MTSHSILQAVARRWRVVLACVLLATASAAGTAFLLRPKYEAHVQIFVAAQDQGAQDLAAAFQGGQFTTARVQSYVNLVTSPEVTQPVIQQLHLPYTPVQLAQEISASTPQNTVLLDISVTDHSARRAYLISGAIAGSFISFVNRLETTPAGNPVKLSISSPPALTPGPIFPDKPLAIALGMFIGLAIGLAAAVIRDRMDDTIKTEREITETYGLPVLASIPLDSSVPDGVASLGSASALSRVETLRQLRTTLRYIDLDRAPQCFVITSCTAGEGKSSTALGLAAVIANGESYVTLVEGDLRRPTLAAAFGLHDDAPGLTEVLGDLAELNDTPCEIGVIRDVLPQTRGRLDLLPAGRGVPNPSELLASGRMRDLVQRLRDRCDILVIDSPPLLAVTDAAVLAKLSDGVIVLVQPRKTRHSELGRALKILEQVGARVVGVVANKTVPRSGTYYASAYYGRNGRSDAASSLGSQHSSSRSS